MSTSKIIGIANVFQWGKKLREKAIPSVKSSSQAAIKINEEKAAISKK